MKIIINVITLKVLSQFTHSIPSINGVSGQSFSGKRCNIFPLLLPDPIKNQKNIRLNFYFVEKHKRMMSIWIICHNRFYLIIDYVKQTQIVQTNKQNHKTRKELCHYKKNIYLNKTYFLSHDRSPLSQNNQLDETFHLNLKTFFLLNAKNAPSFSLFLLF